MSALEWQLARMDTGATESDAALVLASVDDSLPHHERIAAAFALGLSVELGADIMAQIRRANAALDPYACASHDYCDANVVMAEAFAEVMGRDFLPDEGAPSDADCTLWNQAWHFARSHYLTAKESGE